MVQAGNKDETMLLTNAFLLIHMYISPFKFQLFFFALHKLHTSPRAKRSALLLGDSRLVGRLAELAAQIVARLTRKHPAFLLFAVQFDQLAYRTMLSNQNTIIFSVYLHV